MNIILLTGYIILLLITVIYAAVIIYHVLKYHHEDLSPRRALYSKKVLGIYITVSTILLIVSIGVAIIMFIAP